MKISRDAVHHRPAVADRAEAEIRVRRVIAERHAPYRLTGRQVDGVERTPRRRVAGQILVIAKVHVAAMRVADLLGRFRSSHGWGSRCSRARVRVPSPTDGRSRACARCALLDHLANLPVAHPFEDAVEVRTGFRCPRVPFRGNLPQCVA